MASARTDIVSALRSHISDERASQTALSIAVDNNAKRAFLEISNGFLTITVEGGDSVAGIRYNLTLPTYDTVGALAACLQKEKGYEVVLTEGTNLLHPSVDLRVEGIPNVARSTGTAAALKHRIFSDDELIEFLTNAISLHNPNYTLTSVPRNEWPFVLKKAAAESYRRLAADGAKRRGLDADAATLLQLAQDLERQYDADLSRLQRVIPAPKVDDSHVGTGHVMQGMLTRRHTRTGLTTPGQGSLPPVPPSLLDPADNDVEDVIVRLRWSRNRDEGFVRYELWRDTRPEVERSSAGMMDSTNVGSGQIAEVTPYSKPSTARQILVAYGRNVIDLFTDRMGSNVTFVDGLIYDRNYGSAQVLGEPLEPGTAYYYRLYAVTVDGEMTHSEVKRVTTKARRALFARTNGLLSSSALDVKTGPLAGGTSVTITGENFASGMRVTIGGKEATITSLAPTQVVVTSPAFSNADFKGRRMDVVLQSANGLLDIAQNAWVYT
jgi:hypothetical protein